MCELHAGTPVFVVTGALVVEGAGVVIGAAVVTAQENTNHFACCISPRSYADIAAVDTPVNRSVQGKVLKASYAKFAA